MLWAPYNCRDHMNISGALFSLCRPAIESYLGPAIMPSPVFLPAVASSLGQLTGIILRRSFLKAIEQNRAHKGKIGPKIGP